MSTKSSQPSSSKKSVIEFLLVPGAILMVLAGCMTNVVSLEFMVKKDPGVGNLLTFLQFLFLAAEGAIVHFQPRLHEEKQKPKKEQGRFTRFFGSFSVFKQRMVPLKYQFLIVAVFMFVSVVNNKALDYQIPLPLHMVIRSGSLIVSFILGLVVLNKAFNLRHFVCVLVVTGGIILATFQSAKSQKDAIDFDLATWGIGVSMLVAALVFAALLGILQEKVFDKFGKSWRENMFYNHALALPFFLPMAYDIWHHAVIITDVSESFWGLPDMWMYMLANCVSQYLCIRGVYSLIMTQFVQKK